jgi:hypothetical protein
MAGARDNVTLQANEADIPDGFVSFRDERIDLCDQHRFDLI